MTKVDTAELIKNLKKKEVRVEFTKVDGSKRSMLCTMDKSRITESKLPAGKVKPTPGIITVFDLEKNDWRSMREVSVRKWTVEA